MTSYILTKDDSGGVHTNSNIHNRAAYNLLVARDNRDEKAVFSPLEVAILYYLCLARLDKFATFDQARQTLLNVAGTYFQGDPDRADRLDAIKRAYALVGIDGAPASAS
jgi:bacillolysin/neutral peptidase B